MEQFLLSIKLQVIIIDWTKNVLLSNLQGVNINDLPEVQPSD